MKNIRKLSELQEKELTSKEKYTGGRVPPDRPSRPTGGARPPFDRAK